MGKGAEISYVPWGGIYEIPTATLPMPKLPMGFRFSEKEVLPRMWDVAADRVGCAHRCEKWDYIRDWEEHKREAMRRFEQHTQEWRTGMVKAEEKLHSPRRWIQ